jgi:predicted acetyltransferase
LEIRAAGKSDIKPLAELWAHAFPGERTVDQRVRQLEAGGVYGGIETVWVASDAGELAAAYRAYRLQQHLHGAILPMLGVAAVAVAAHARRRGIGAEICRAALRHGRERGDVVSVLYPFRPSFYEALGWGLAGSFHSYRFRPEALPVTHAQPRVRLLHDAPGVIAACYEVVARRSNGLIARNARIWRQHVEWPDVHVFGLDRGGKCAGYVVVHYGGALLPDDRPLTIRELIAVDDDAYNELLSWVSLQRDLWRLVQYEALPSERFDLRLAEPRTPGVGPSRTLFAQTATVLRGAMMRVLDVPAALEARRTWPAANFAFSLRVRDRELPENCGPFEVAVRDGEAAVTAGEIVSTSVTALETNASTFAQIYVGEISVRDAVRLGRATASGDVNGLDALFRTEPEFRILDEF